MSAVKQYKKFKDGLDGYVEVPFGEFRAKIAPLARRRGDWSPAEAGYVEALAAAGAGAALQEFLGTDHPSAAKVLGGARLAREPMSKAELDDHMRHLTKNCLAAGWTPQLFAAFAAYLDSDLTPGQLAEQDREARRLRRLEDSALAPAGAPGPAPADAWDGEEAPERDRFAEAYRGAGPAFKRAVGEHLALAAEKARRPADAQ